MVQHEAESDTTELLEYKVVENILDSRPTKGIAWSEWPVREVLAGAEGFSGAGPEGVARLRSCVEESTGAGEFVGAEDWGYIRPVADGVSPFCVRPVTGSHLFGSSMGRVLGLRQPHLPFRHDTWGSPFLLSSVLVGHDVGQNGLACAGPG